MTLADPREVATDPPAIAVDRLVKRYGTRTVVDEASLEVHRGEIVALLGPNGAGKTTTVEIIEGYGRPDAGTVAVLGIDPRHGGRALRARVGVMLQAGGVDMRARPRETLRQYAAFHADARDPDDLIERLGLTTVVDTPYRRLSGGERQRLAFAMALVGRPEVVLLDEPTAGMDPEIRSFVRAEIDALRADGLAVLLTSHDLVDVERLADRIVVLVEGRIVASGTPRALADRTEARLRFRLEKELDVEATAALGRAIGRPVRRTSTMAYEVEGAAPTPELMAALATACAARGRLIVESRTVGGSLEDVYLDLVRTGGRDDATTASAVR